MAQKVSVRLDNLIRIPCTKDTIFRKWLEFLSPFHRLTDRELDVATAFLKARDELSKVILDSKVLDRNLMSEETQRKIKQECSLTNQHFQVIKSKLKNKHFFKDGGINDKLIPHFDGEDKSNFFTLLYFQIKDNVQE